MVGTYLAVRLVGTGGQFGLSDVPMYVRFYLQPGIALIAVSALVAKVRNRPGLLAILASVVIPGVAMWTAVRYGGPSQPEVLVSAIATVGCLVFLIVNVGRQVVRYAAVRRTRGKIQITGR